ncbi:transglycosylase domain-containing protein [Alloiococcus sp. CFN-8]|uniref:transglycosylase domain-containing protein n=1 Tax=Alloiococcus sp. CFN-8 TaxID=3416081 RepID=UPI003CEA6C7F
MTQKKKNGPKNKKKRTKKKSVFRIILITFLFITVSAIIGAGGYVYSVIKSAPELDVDAILNLEQISMVYDDNEEFMDNVPSRIQRIYVDINEMPQFLKDAFVAIEDERFETHNGIDIRRLIGVVLKDIKVKLTGRGALQGASTITQQLIKNTMLTNDVKISRKITEIYLAINLEKQLTKPQILEAYLNTIPLGGTTYGVEAGSHYYFNKGVKDLTLIEAAYLAGVTQSPHGYNAFIEENVQDPSRYISRTKTVLSMMLDNEKLTQEEFDGAMAELDAGKLQESFVWSDGGNNIISNKLNYEWFTRPVIEQVKEDLMNEYNYTEEEAANLLEKGGLKIYSTMDRELQNYTQEALDNDSILNSISKADENGVKQPQASAVIMDYKTGEVKVMVGGRGDQPALSYNRAYDSDKFSRATGSAIKPLTVYAPAIDSRFATAAKVYEDSPLRGSLLSEYGGSLKNSPNNYSGYITMREAVRRSVNIYAVKLVYNMGKGVSASYAEKFGIDMKNEKGNLASLALGEFSGSTTYQMAAAYGTFGNNGVYTAPRLYTKVVDKDGKVILKSKIEDKTVISPQAAYITYNLLKGPLTYTATNVSLGSMPAAGKTGTSSGNKNYWFAGLTPHYSAAVWVGTDLNEAIDNYSSNKASGLWSKIMSKANEGLSTTDIKSPSGIVSAQVCSVSGLLPTELCRKGHAGRSCVVTEYFVSGTVPKALCDLHVEAEVNSKNGLLATENTPDNLRVKKIFIVRDYTPSVTLGDSKYVLPTKMDDTKPEPVKDEDKDTDKDKAPDKDADKKPDKNPDKENDKENDKDKNESNTDKNTNTNESEQDKNTNGDETGNQSGNNVDGIIEDMENIIDSD